MNAISILFALGFFFLLILASFSLQIYIATRVYESNTQKVIGMLRGTRTFIRGWRFAKEMDLTGLMVMWSFLLALLLLWLIPIAYFGAQGEFGGPTQRTVATEAQPLPMATPLRFDEPICGITRPEAEANHGGVITAEGFVTIAPQYLDHWELRFYPEGKPDQFELLREPSSIPSPQTSLALVKPGSYPAGRYTLDLIVTLKGVPDNIPNPCRHIVSFYYRG